jgi:hypothetical protein
MKSDSGTSKDGTTRGLRTGKIHTSKSSATEIRRSVGVTPSDTKVATRALRVAARAATTGKFVAVKKDRRPGSKGGSNAKKR